MVINGHSIDETVRDERLTFLDHELFTVSKPHFHDGYHVTTSAFAAKRKKRLFKDNWNVDFWLSNRK